MTLDEYSARMTSLLDERRALVARLRRDETPANEQRLRAIDDEMLELGKWLYEATRAQILDPFA